MHRRVHTTMEFGAEAMHDATASPFSSLAPILGRPMQISKINPHLSFSKRSFVSIYDFIRKHNDVLSFVIIDQVQMLQCADDVIFLDAGTLTDFTKTMNLP